MSKADKHANNAKKLIGLLKNGSFQDRARAAFHLGEMRDHSHLPLLKEALKDPVPNVVKEVVEALKKVGPDAEAEQLMKERQQQIYQEGTKIQERIAEQWKEKTEEEKQAELERYAAESHLRANRRKVLNMKNEKSSNNRIVQAILDLLRI